MIKILLIEDEAPKRQHIANYLTEIVPDLQLSCAYSVNSAVSALEKEIPNILLLDMSLPTYDIGDNEGGGRPQGFGGVEVMRDMINTGITCPVIVITGYEAFPKTRGIGYVDLTELRAEIKKEFGDLVAEIIHFNSAHDEWKDTLSKTLRYRLNNATINR